MGLAGGCLSDDTHDLPCCLQGLGQSSDMDPTNTTLFIGGLTDPSVTEDLLRAIFSPYGPIIYTKIPAGKGCGFVQFVHRTSAEHAMNSMNQQPIGSSIARISWGRSANKPGPTTPYGPQVTSCSCMAKTSHPSALLMYIPCNASGCGLLEGI